MTKEEQTKYFKFYRGEEQCPAEWRGKAEGIIWGAEKVAEENWERIVSGEFDKNYGYEPRPIEETLEDIVVSTAQKFDPWSWEEVAAIYEKATAS